MHKTKLCLCLNQLASSEVRLPSCGKICSTASYSKTHVHRQLLVVCIVTGNSVVVMIPGMSCVFEFVTLVNTSKSGALFRFESYFLRDGFILGLVCVSLIL